MTSKAPDPASKITNPRRLLILSPPSQSQTTIPPLLHSLTGIPIENPDQPTQSFAGYTTHSPLSLSTKYYSADVPIWVDEVATSSEWRTEFLSDEAEIVREALGALLIAVRNPEGVEPESSDVRACLDLMRDVGAVKEGIEEERGGGDVAGVFVLIGKGTRRSDTSEGEGLDEVFSAGWWEDQLFDAGLVGWEVIVWDPKAEDVKRNQYGEYEGMPRIREVLETHDWSGSSSQDPDFEFDDDDLETELLGYGRSEHTPGFGHEVQELEREMLGLRMAIERGGGDGDEFDDEEEENKVESMEALMMRVQGIRDMGADLPEAERKKFAAKAVSDLMREL